MVEGLRQVQLNRFRSAEAELTTGEAVLARVADAGQGCKSIKAPILFGAVGSKPVGNEDLGGVHWLRVSSRRLDAARKSAAYNWDICS